MKFVYMAECMPAKVDTWFRGFHHGGVIEADSLEAAQEKLNELCRGYGSDTDPRFINGGPYAQAMITRRK